MMRLFALLFCLMPALAMASDWPALMNVTGVQANDHLNIRERATTASPVIGKLGANDTNVEIVGASEDAKWGIVNIGEGIGWVSLRYMMRSGAADSLPDDLYCSGTEPFWAASFGAETMRFSSPESEELEIATNGRRSSANRVDRYSITSKASDGSFAVAVITRRECSDGMSDRAYGLSLDLILRTNDIDAHLTGCCSLSQ